jgi:hypothetical protein
VLIIRAQAGGIAAGDLVLTCVGGLAKNPAHGTTITFSAVSDKSTTKITFQAGYAIPTSKPTAWPTAAPTALPTAAPTAVPTAAPTIDAPAIAGIVFGSIAMGLGVVSLMLGGVVTFIVIQQKKTHDLASTAQHVAHKTDAAGGDSIDRSKSALAERLTSRSATSGARGARDGAQLSRHGSAQFGRSNPLRRADTLAAAPQRAAGVPDPAQFGRSNPMRRTDTLTVAPRRAAGVPDRAADAAGATALLGSSTPLSGGGSETENETRLQQWRAERRATRAKHRVQSKATRAKHRAKSKEEADRASSANETSVVGVPDRAADAAAAAAPLGPRSSTPLSGGGSETEETGSEY